MELRSIPVGEGKQEYMHTISGGEESSPPLVCLPGYGAGAAFYFRNFDGLAQQFRLHLVDLLGTGMSGDLADFVHLMQAARRCWWFWLAIITNEPPMWPALCDLIIG